MDKIELDCPKGFKFLGFRKVNPGEWYFEDPGDIPDQWIGKHESHCRYFVFEKKPPRRIVFEEVIGATIVHEGDCYTDEYTSIPEVWTGHDYSISEDEHTTVWRWVNDN